MREGFPGRAAHDSALEVYLLGCVDFEAMLRLQRRLHFEVTGDRRLAALVVCEHPPLVTVGRQGSRSHIRLDASWPVRWVNRGGGCILHVPGQLGLYSILPLDRLGLDISQYLQRLTATICDLLGDFSVEAHGSEDQAGVFVGARPAALLGVGVRNWVTTYGAYVNIHPPLDLFNHVDVLGATMTSLERERGGPVRPSLVRERLVEHFRTHLGFEHATVFTEHPALEKAPRRAAAAIRDLERA